MYIMKFYKIYMLTLWVSNSLPFKGKECSV